jgi:hypothetical protein
VTLTVVMAHAQFAEQRREMLPRVTASWEDRLDHIVEDRLKAGAWPTVRACWQTGLELGGHQGHVLAAQDDFVLAEGAAELMADLCEQFPDRVMSFRWPQASCSWLWHHVEKRDVCWARTNHAWTGGAVALPAALVTEFLEWAQRFDDAGGHRYEHMDDARLDMWTLATGTTVWRTRWSLMKHIGDSYSVVRRNARTISPEMGLVDNVDEVVPLSDSRWAVTEVPEYTDWPEAFRLNASTMLKGRQRELGLQ